MTKRKTAEPEPAAAAALGELLDQAAAAPGVIEFGRYRVFQAPDGGWVIARAVNICDRCQECGCGDQAEPVQIPAMVIQLARSGGTGLMGKLKALRNGGGLPDG
jgi:hypothetical protein